MLITAAGPKQVVTMRQGDGSELRLLVVHDGPNVVQIPFDPVEAALIARDLSPSAGAAAKAVDDRITASGLHVVGDAGTSSDRDGTDDPALD